MVSPSINFLLLLLLPLLVKELTLITLLLLSDRLLLFSFSLSFFLLIIVPFCTVVSSLFLYLLCCCCCCCRTAVAILRRQFKGAHQTHRKAHVVREYTNYFCSSYSYTRLKVLLGDGRRRRRRRRRTKVTAAAAIASSPLCESISLLFVCLLFCCQDSLRLPVSRIWSARGWGWTGVKIF